MRLCGGTAVRLYGCTAVCLYVCASGPFVHLCVCASICQYIMCLLTSLTTVQAIHFGRSLISFNFAVMQRDCSRWRDLSYATGIKTGSVETLAGGCTALLKRLRAAGLFLTLCRLHRAEPPAGSITAS